MGKVVSDKEWNLFLRLLRAGLWERPIFLLHVPDEEGSRHLLETARQQYTLFHQNGEIRLRLRLRA